MSFFMQINRLVSPNPYKEMQDESLQVAQEQHAVALKLALSGGSKEDCEKAVKLWKMAAYAGLAEAQIHLSACYGIGVCVHQNFKKQAHLIFKAFKAKLQDAGDQCQTGSTNISFSEISAKSLRHAYEKNALAACLYHGTGMAQNLNDAASLWKEAAHMGVAESQFHLSQCYQFGKGVPLNPAKQVKWLKKALRTNPNNTDALIALATCFLTGRGVSQNAAEAFDLLTTAARLGSSEAIVKRALCYLRGCGVPQHIQTALTTLRDEEKRGSALAKLELGICLKHGMGVEKDVSGAFILLSEAMRLGSLDAKIEVAKCLKDGIGVPVQREEAILLLKEASLQGSMLASVELGVWNLFSNGAPFNREEAFKLFQATAQAGEPLAIFWLGRCFHLGLHVPVNIPLAITHYTQASLLGCVQAKVALGTLHPIHTYATADELSIKWLAAAANQGSAIAKLELGKHLLAKLELPRILQSAHNLLREAANQGNSEAQSMLANLQHLLHDVEKK